MWKCRKDGVREKLENPVYTNKYRVKKRESKFVLKSVAKCPHQELTNRKKQVSEYLITEGNISVVLAAICMALDQKLSNI